MVGTESGRSSSRRLRWLATAGVIATSACLLASAGTAQAAHPRASSTFLMAQTSLDGGLRLRVLGFSLGGRQWVNLSISRGGWQRQTKVDYSPLDLSPANRPRFVRTRLGERGSIAMRFQPSRRLSGGGACDDSRGWAGALVGHLRFRAPQRWVDVRETRLHATLFKQRKSHCRREERPRGALLVSCSREGALFMATHTPDGRLGYEASSAPRERRGLYVRDSISLTDAGGGFVFSSNLKRATIKPPAPFHGEAIFRDHRLLSGLSFESLHGPDTAISDAPAQMKEIESNNSAYLYACAPAPSSAAGAAAAVPSTAWP